MFQPGFGESEESQNEVCSLIDFQSDPAQLLAEVRRSHKPLVLTVEDKPAVVVQEPRAISSYRTGFMN